MRQCLTLTYIYVKNGRSRQKESARGHDDNGGKNRYGSGQGSSGEEEGFGKGTGIVAARRAASGCAAGGECARGGGDAPRGWGPRASRADTIRCGRTDFDRTD